MTPSEGAPSSVKFGYHLVVYIDLLGQRKELETIRRVPQTEEEKRATTEAIARSAGRVHQIRSYFTQIIRDTAKIDPEIVAKVPPEKRESYLRLRTFSVRHVGFSDTFVVSVPFAPNTEPEGIACTIMSVWAVLVGAAAVSLLAMSREIPLRGGLTVGTAVDLFENEAYGAALMEAYRLESTVAEYNRIIVGSELFDYLNEVENLPDDRPFSKMARERAQECRGLICMAPDDNLPMVHPLAPYIVNFPTSTPGESWEELRAPARAWVVAEAQRFADERNYKMWGRYVRLLRYFDAYSPTTGLAPERTS